ncbi:hypothetical protein IJH15_03395 [Candidatus Saccharibacteria bacterium]|jgi:hypothetical protein|nr:hypothetical protein [Candidatus Saccharibacteria bacterium]MBR3253349.1 hypothetical protein [Candidatus Saccharibacteria bacterium]
MEQFPNNTNNEDNGAGEEGVMSEKARKMLIESLKNTLKNRDTDNNKVNPNSPLTDEYYDKVEEVLKEGGNL